MKRKLDLRTGRPVWMATRAPSVPTQRLTRDVKADVLVVGMGISGAMTAQALAADGHDVVCVDRRAPLVGSTSASTALVQFEIDQPLSVLGKSMGGEKAARAWRRSRLAVDGLHAAIQELGIRCDMAERVSLYLDGNVLSPAQLREEGVARRAAGLYAAYLEPAELSARFGIEGRSALLGAGNLAVDPRKMTAGFLRTAAASKARLYAPVEISRMTHESGGIVAETVGGPTIRAGHAVMATGYELLDDVPKAPHQVISTWAIATRPQPRALWPEGAMLWEASDPYLYMRTTRGGRVICGGEDEEFTDETRRDAMIAEKTEAIAAKLKALFPALDTEPDFAWAGAFGTTATGLPFIGQVPRKPRFFAVMGYGGNGITYSRIASELIRTTLAGADDRDADLYAFPRG